jgi:hypothetical protein
MSKLIFALAAAGLALLPGASNAGQPFSSAFIVTPSGSTISGNNTGSNPTTDLTGANNGMTITAHSNAHVGPNGNVSLHSSSSVSGTALAITPPPSTQYGAIALAGLTDTVVITDGAKSGSGTLYIPLDYNGVLSGSSAAFFNLEVATVFSCHPSDDCVGKPGPTGFVWGPSFLGTTLGSQFSLFSQSINVPVSGSAVIATVPFTYGAPVNFEFYLASEAVMQSPTPGAFSSISSNFWDTATLKPLLVVDGSGGVDRGASVVSTVDGMSYSATVPEPSTWTAMLIGLGAVGAAFRRRKPEPLLS